MQPQQQKPATTRQDSQDTRSQKSFISRAGTAYSMHSHAESERSMSAPSTGPVTSHFNKKRFSFASVGGPRGTGISLSHIPERRASFINRWQTDLEFSRNMSRNLSLTGGDGGLSRIHGSQDVSTPDSIVTPFAQVLVTLKKIRYNFMMLTKSNNKPPDANSETSDSTEFTADLLNEEERYTLILETMQDFDFCLENLESIKTHRSVSDMASRKFKMLLSVELNQLSEGNKSDNVISEYISSTFLDNLDTGDEPDSPHDAYDEDRKSTMSQVDHTMVHSCRAHMPLTHTTGLNPLLKKITFTAESDIPKCGMITSFEKELNKLLQESLDQWGMDIFEVSRLSNEHPLTAVTLAIFERHNLMQTFNIPQHTLVSFLLSLETYYYSDVAYHNSTHAADVTQSAHVLISVPTLKGAFSDLEILALIFACSIHDVNHPGVTNQYLVNYNDSLALIYNDYSVLENHHLAVAFTLLADEHCDIFANLNKKQRSSVRRLTIDMVLATDMSKHMTLLADFKTMLETKRVAGSKMLNKEIYADRLLILQNLVHCADLSNPTKPLPIYQKWVERIMMEFFMQGDKERELGLDVSPMCDRNTSKTEKTQVSFIDFIVLPLWEIWTELTYPDCQHIFEHLQENRDWYSRQLKETEES